MCEQCESHHYLFDLINANHLSRTRKRTKALQWRRRPLDGDEEEGDDEDEEGAGDDHHHHCHHVLLLPLLSRVEDEKYIVTLSRVFVSPGFS